MFILTLIGTTASALILPDVILGGWRSGISRYVIPCHIGIQLAVAYLLLSQVVSVSISRRKSWQAVMAVLLSLEVLSCTISAQAKTWWNKYPGSYNTLRVAHIINQAENPLVISSETGELFSLSYLLKLTVHFQLFDRMETSSTKISDDYDTRFLFGSSKFLYRPLNIDHRYKLKPIQKSQNFWQLQKHK